MKKVISAHLKEIIQFDSQKEVDKYLEKQHNDYIVVSNIELDGKIILTILKRYGNVALLNERQV